jgi:hypothetical protein
MGFKSLRKLEYHDNKITNPQMIYPKPCASNIKNHLKRHFIYNIPQSKEIGFSG